VREVDRQQSSTQDLLSAIIRSVGRGRPWIPSTTVYSRIQKQVGSLHGLTAGNLGR